MQKTRNRSEASGGNVSYTSVRRSMVTRPEVVSTDVLETMLDEDLIAHFRALDSSMRLAYESSAQCDLRPWEEEIAYVRREQQVRRGRREAHTAYVQRTEREFNLAEMNLPPGDFDNSAFVYAASGGRPRWS